MTDRNDELVAAVALAVEQNTALAICGGNSKAHMLGRDLDDETVGELHLSTHTGIVDYHPTELVITARAGTPLRDIKHLLAKEGQMLAFEPPDFDGRATLGGTLACNMSGPARPWQGSCRDMVLGVQLINGRAELLNFGGQVMKNVAGYDVSRLQAGALGTLGVLTQVSLKVLPMLERHITLSYEMNATAAIELMNRRSAIAKPLSGACWTNGLLYLRLSGDNSAVTHTARQWGGDEVARGTEFWRSLREFTHPFFTTPEPLWRFSLCPTAPTHQSTKNLFIDWGGAQRWLRGTVDRAALENEAEQVGGHVSLFRGGDRSQEVKHPLSPVHREFHQRLKHAFDPQGIFNPGRLYSWM